MILSRRHYAFEGARVETDKWAVESGAFRRNFITGVSQDESLTIRTLGHGTEHQARGRLTIVLGGMLTATVEGQSTELGAGTIVGAERVELLVINGGEALTLEIDWTNGRNLRGRDTLSPGARLAQALAIEAALLSQGIVLEGVGASFAEKSPPADQAYMSALDATLKTFQDAPQSVDWEAHAGRTRRTLSRRTHAFHERYGLSGVRKRTDWRAVRDFHRLLIATIFLTHENATAASVAKAVGYGSPGALCHAFANAGLPSPGQVRAHAHA